MHLCFFAFPDIQFFIPAHDSLAHPFNIYDQILRLDSGLMSGSDDHSSRAVQRRDRGMFPDLLSCTVEVAFLHNHFVLHAAGNVYESHRLLLCSTVRTSKPRYSNTGIRISRENTAECYLLAVCSLTALGIFLKLPC